MKNNVNNCAMSCYGCGACVSTCPVNAIEYYMNKDGFYDVKIDEDKYIWLKNVKTILDEVKVDLGINNKFLYRKVVVFLTLACYT